MLLKSKVTLKIELLVSEKVLISVTLPYWKLNYLIFYIYI